MEGIKTMSVLGERLTKLREAKGWSKTHAAEKLGVKAMSTYANWEYGNREPDAGMLIKIAEVYEVTTDYLLGRSEFADYDHCEQKRFEQFSTDPDLQRWFSELPKTAEEDKRKLKKMWDLIKDNH